MKTHDLVPILQQLVDSHGARSSPSAERLPKAALDGLKELTAKLSDGPNVSLSDVRIAKQMDDMAVGLRMLSSLSNYSKQQWVALANEYQMKIEFNPRDSARDALGRVLRYLDANPEMVPTLGTKSKRTKVDTSELENALTKLLGRKDE